ncbi:MAG: Eco57I restriction-modification methylase domain-containing protein [Actinomycetota bacterium]
MAELTKAAKVQAAFARSGFTGLFVDELGWESPSGAVPPVGVEDATYYPKIAAMLKGFRIYVVPSETLPSRQTMRTIDRALAELSPERMEIFQAPEGWVWHWPRRTNGGTTTFEAAPTRPGTLPTYLAQRLTGLEFTVADHRRGVSLADVRDRVHGRFDASGVTKKFYERFAEEQSKLALAIEGVPASEKYSYSTTLLNRLMFIYFLQKKEFLNSDPLYLEHTLQKVQALRGKDQYYGFYRDALMPLFFDKLNDRDGVVKDQEIRRILGDVPYVNGGIFGRTDLEIEHAHNLEVPDAAFERILSFFGAFNWHLDTRPTGNPNEINPEVIGYIFEQFVNVAATGKKENGAYYTPHDVTAYMVAQTLIPRILDDLEQIEVAFELLKADPDRYIQPTMLHGWDAANRTWVEAPDELVERWRDDPITWAGLDAAGHDPRLCLPGETWVEMFHRRERLDSLRTRITSGQMRAVNDFVTENLNAQLLLTDAIDALDDGQAVAKLFDQVTALSVFDPTCGSGAFLFAALEVLEDVYDHLIDEARTVAQEPAAAALLAQVDTQPGKRYFIRKHIAIRNLYGTDLMPGAIETAKLRIFLALAACVDARDELRPLPDLDFNLKTGNLVVGFKDADDVNRIGADLLTSSQLFALQPKIDAHAALYEEFSKAVEDDTVAVADLKMRLRTSEHSLRAECDALYAEQSRVPQDGFEKWKQDSRPFHWFCEFPDIISRGGFDVVIGNPPYVRMSKLPGYTVVGYEANKCPDLYAVCYERSLSLLSPSGRHAFIVMLNLSFSDQYAPLRRVIAARNGSEWWSSYGKWPTQLFAGIRVANTMLIVGPGSERASTRHHIFGPEHREHLFQGVEYAAFARTGGEAPIRGGIAEDLLRTVDAWKLPAGAPGAESLYLRPTGQYWFPVLFGVPPVLDSHGSVIEQADHRVRQLRLGDGESRLIAGAALAGKVTYAWWSAVGDDFDCNPDEAEIGRKLAAAVPETAELLRLARAVRDAGKRQAFVSKNNDGYINVRWTAARDATDAFDRAILETAGLLEYWRPLNIWYRQCMRSTRPNHNSRYLTPEEIDDYLSW